MDLASFEKLFRELHAPLCEVVDSYVRSQAVAEEIVQDVFFMVWMRRETLPSSGLRAYLFTAARNRALIHLRHRSVVRRWSLWIESRPDVAGVAAAAASADVALADQERRAALRAAIDRLPPRSRLALVLQQDHHMSLTEIATAMGISVKGVEKLLSLAKARLRELLAAHAPDSSRRA